MTSADDSCVFCRIVTGRADASIVAGTDLAVAFMDVDPATPGQVLVVPRVHRPALADLTEPEAQQVFALARRVAAGLRASSVRCEGVNLFYADGAAAFQEVFHAHLHVLPRFEGDGFSIHAGWGSRPDRAVLDDQAAAIRAAIGDGLPAEV